MRTESVIRQEILEKVAELYKVRKAREEFIPGETRVNYGGRVYDEKEMTAVVDSVLDFWLTLGKKGKDFIDAFTAYMGVQHGLVTNSGSSANLLAISALCSGNIANPLLPGDEVITTASTFPTTLNPIVQNRLIPVFVDIEEDTYNIDAALIEEAISPRTRAVMFAHTLGNPAEMDKIMEIAARHNLYVIEDNCDSLDSRYDGKLCGTFGDLSTFSFYAAHHITMGEGGAVLTHDLELYRQLLSIRDWGRACYCRGDEQNPKGACGRRFECKLEGLPGSYDHKYVYSNIGYNLKPLDIQCAMGMEQLKKLPGFTLRRKHNFSVLYNGLKPYEDRLLLPRSLPKAEPSWFAIPITVREDAGFTRKDLVTWLESRLVETRMLFTGNILKHPAYKKIEYRNHGDFKNTQQVLERTFFLGVYPGMTEEKLEYMLQCMEEFFKRR